MKRKFKNCHICLFFLGLLGYHAFAVSDQDSSQSVNAIAKRLEPFGKIAILGQKQNNVSIRIKNKNTRSGKIIYETICSDCHATGEVHSPKFGKQKDWESRYKLGYENLYRHAINGFHFMPPRGTCDTCSDEEIKATVKYIIENSIKN
ncbi:MAG: hypothetical protein LEGION0398_MBIBDBAK_00090 [Legionellaceae bacterium]